MAKNVDNPSDVNEKVEEWIHEYLKDDVDINLNIADTAREFVFNHFKVDFTDPETVIAFYATVYDTIVEIINKKREKNSAFALNFCNRFEIGYSDSDDMDNEKQGSLAPYIIQLNAPSDDLRLDKPDGKSSELACQWNAANIKEDPDVIDQIMSAANRKLAALDLELQYMDLIPGMFAVIHTTAVKELQTMFEENYKEDDIDTYELRVNLFTSVDVFLRKKEDGSTSIQFKSSVSTKQGTKNDGIATAKHE